MNVIYPSCNGRETTTFELVHPLYYPPPLCLPNPLLNPFHPLLLPLLLSLSLSLRLNERQTAHRGKISRGWGVVKAEKLR